MIAFASLAVFAGIAFFSFTPPAVESSGIGTRVYALQNLPDTATNATLAASHMSIPIAANQEMHVRFSIPFSLSATNLGIKFQVVVPSGGVAFNSAAVVYSDADSVVLVSTITSSAAQGTALATTGNHKAVIDAYISNGSTAGNVVLQFAQNSSNTGNAILLVGGFAEVVKF